MTWDDLGFLISKLSPAQKKTDVTVYFPYEEAFCPMVRLYINHEDDVLDAEHPYLSDY